MIENRTFDEIAVGDSASLVRTLSREDIQLFAAMSGDVNPAHVDPDYAATDQFHKIIAHGMWGGALISAVLGTRLPGPGTIYLGQDLRFKRPVGVGDTVSVTVTAKEKRADKKIILFDCRCTNQKGEDVITGTAEVKAPLEKVVRPRVDMPEVALHYQQQFQPMFDRCRNLLPLPTAVVHPCTAAALQGAIDAAAAELIAPVLVGPAAKINLAAAQLGVDIAALPLIDTLHSHAAAAQAVTLARRSEVAALMQGSLSTEELMHAVLASDSGLRTERRISHMYLAAARICARPLLITDAAINVSPSLQEKADICRNAIDVTRAIGVAAPRVAVLSALNTIHPKLRSTLDAAALCKMAERGQITGGTLDGPLTFDRAVQPQGQYGIGGADVLLVPDMEAGDMLVKQLEFMGDADIAAVIAGARIPIISAVRGGSQWSGIASCAAALLMSRAQSVSNPEIKSP